MKDVHARVARTVSEAGGANVPTPAGLCGHDVQFYRTDRFLRRAVVDFLASGLRAGHPIVVIATPEHRRQFLDGLKAKGLDPAEPFSGHVAEWLDARETLSCFMEWGRPNRELFMLTVGRVFERLLEKRQYLIIRGYGEMVDLLWKEGNTAGALELEALWNELAERYAYALLCGYSLENFMHLSAVDGVRRICGHHTNALPVEDLDENVA